MLGDQSVVVAKNSVLVFILLWFAVGESCVWAASDEPEDSREAQPAGWLATVAGTVRDVVWDVQEAVSHPVDDTVSVVEDLLVGILALDATTGDAEVVQVDYWLPVAEGIPEVDVAGFVNDAVPAGTGLLLLQVDRDDAGFVALQGDGIDAVVSTAASVCKDYVLVPVETAKSIVGGFHDHVATNLAPIGSTMTGTWDRARTSMDIAVVGGWIEELASEAVTSADIAEWGDTNADGVGIQVHHALDTLGLDDWGNSAAAGVAVGLITGSRAGTVHAAEAAANTWEVLSIEVKQKFRRRGLRTGMKVRTEDMAEALYGTVPQSVRASGEDAVLEFLDKYDLSHIKPVSEFPKLAYDLDNVVWEEKTLNRKRGPYIMDASAIQAAKEALALEELKARRALAARSARRALSRGWIGAVGFEAPVVTLENLLHVHHGRMNPEEAMADGVVDIATTVVVGGAVSGAMSLAGHSLTANVVPIMVAVAPQTLAAAPTVLSVAPTVLAVLPVVTVGGLVLYTGHTVYRLCEAAQPDPPDLSLAEDPAIQ